MTFIDPAWEACQNECHVNCSYRSTYAFSMMMKIILSEGSRTGLVTINTYFQLIEWLKPYLESTIGSYSGIDPTKVI